MNDTTTDTARAEAVGRVRALLDQAAAILADELADEPGGWRRAELLPDIELLHDLASSADPRRLLAG
jgi:hypothetical protein